MKSLKLIFMFLSFSFFFVATQCGEDKLALTYEEERAELDKYKEKIEDLAATSVCNENTECLFVGFGSKPCGGPWTYLIYTNSINDTQLLLWVNDYNQLEQKLNEKWGIISDCSIASPPVGFECLDNTCNPIF
ncbi:hypothetical protein [Pontimicrobium aquaticum]|uniref:Uncharacterized protein n=1 Tax=Pontimicrobium aquaticum TaxID=2565367 RepID=A0A4U0ESH0_9FLAO|nr:hypothetical protein [Pontimicrobium aquaticum]TJY34693.1 hypothetical protein E5167_10310 [Pontimicrobium aquaticum]